MLPARLKQGLELGAVLNRGKNWILLEAAREKALRDRFEPRERRFDIPLLHARARRRDTEIPRTEALSFQFFELGARFSELSRAKQRFAYTTASSARRLASP